MGNFMQNLTKFQKIVLYMVQHSPGLGAVQLNKALFYTDAAYYAHYGISYTGCEYVKDELGPVPNSKCFKEIGSLVYEGLVKKQFEDIPNVDYIKKAYYVDESLDDDEVNSYFSDFDISLLDILKSTVRFVSNKTARQLSDFTHNFVYHSMRMREVISWDKAVEFVVDNDAQEPKNIEELLRETYAD